MKNNKVKKILRSTLVGAIAATMCFGMNVFAAPQDAPTPTDATAAITKTLKLPSNTTVPQAAFTFNFAYDDEVTGQADQRPNSEITPVTVSYESTDKIDVKVDGGVYGEVQKSVRIPLNADNYSKPDWYYYKVTETPNTQNPEVDKDMTFDTAQYEMLVDVKNKDGADVNSGKYIAGVYFQKLGGAAIDFTIAGNKVTSAGKVEIDGDSVDAYNLFTNTYSPVGNLSLKEMVTGSVADKNKEFSYNVTLTYPKTYSDQSKKFASVNPNDASAPYIFASGKSTIVQLKHGQDIKLANVPAGTICKIEETAASVGDYTTSTEAVIGGQTSTSTNTITNALLKQGDNNITYTNNLDGTTPTGVVMNNIPFVVLVGVGALAIAGYFVSRKRKANR